MYLEIYNTYNVTLSLKIENLLITNFPHIKHSISPLVNVILSAIVKRNKNEFAHSIVRILKSL